MAPAPRTCIVTFPALGTYAVTATYRGDAVYAMSIGAVTQVVDKADVTLAVSSPVPSPVGVGATSTIIATVAPRPPGAGAPTGRVQASSDDATDMVSSYPLALDGTATITVTPTAVGTASRTITVSYSGDAAGVPAQTVWTQRSSRVASGSGSG